LRLVFQPDQIADCAFLKLFAQGVGTQPSESRGDLTLAPAPSFGRARDEASRIAAKILPSFPGLGSIGITTENGYACEVTTGSGQQ
jgi:hypothetical protein